MLVKQAANVIELLEYFARRRSPATLAEISDDLGWPRSSTFNLIGTIVERGYLYEPRPRAGYYPTPRWLSVAEAVAQAEPLPDMARLLAEEVARETGETTGVGTLSGVHALFLHVSESAHSVRYHAAAGDRVPAHASSFGRAILAQMAPAARQAVYRRMDFTPFSPTTPTSAEEVEAELSAAAERGYHHSLSEYIPDLAGVAMPLPLAGRALSIVVAGPTSRCVDRRPAIAAALQAALGRHLPG